MITDNNKNSICFPLFAVGGYANKYTVKKINWNNFQIKIGGL